MDHKKWGWKPSFAGHEKYREGWERIWGKEKEEKKKESEDKENDVDGIENSDGEGRG